MKRILAMLLAAIMLLSLCACGGDGASGKTTVNLMIGGSVEVSSMFRDMVKQFNATVGEEQKIYIKVTDKGSGLSTILSQQLPSNSGPDVTILQDEFFKVNSGYLEDLTAHVDSTVVNDLYPSMVSRYHYDTEANTSNSDDPLYALPVYNDATVLYYNKAALEAVGVICISVPADQLDAFNGGAPDTNGNTKAALGIDVEVPNKGFYRSENPYVPMEGETDGKSWEKPENGEMMIFNDQIPMNWDEIEDLGMICTKDHNAASQTKYGYYTEWWFNHAWSVGGDCVEDLSGNGDWVYTLPSDVPNYIVGEGKSYTGIYTGTAYAAGETLDMKDVLEAAKGDTIAVKTDGTSYMTFTVNGSDAAYRDFSAEIADGTLLALPSTVDAFARFVYLAGEGGIKICPTPNVVGSSTPLYFTSGTLALMMERLSFTSYIEKTMRDGWGIAPLPQYKEYEDPEDPDNDTVIAAGKLTGHSHGYCIGVSKKAKNKDAAYVFVNWMASEGQKYMADNGYISVRQSDRETVVANMGQKNADVIMELVANAQAGDWWYMPSRGWIDTWATDLNYTVRYGGMSLETFLYKNIENANKALADYKK